VGSTVAQDATFSQYYASSLYLNPAFAGVESKVTFSSNYRNQWKGIAGSPYVTSQASLIVPITSKKLDKHIGGVGLSVYNNKAGESNFQSTGINLNFAYNVHLSDMNLLTFGVQGGIVQRTLNTANLQWGSQFNPLIGGYDPNVIVNTSDINGKTSFPDFGGGVMYYFNPNRDYEEKGASFYAGISAFHLTQPNESMIKSGSNKLPMLIKSHLGFEWNISPKFNLSPNVLIARQNNLTQVNAGAYLTFLFGKEGSKVAPSFLLLGSWYRLEDSFIFSAGLGSGNYTLGFSYDLNNSSLRYNSKGTGAYEVSLKVQLGSTKKVKIYNPLI
jgi:type IX secretion system PorP/SprF family membrane protein